MQAHHVLRLVHAGTAGLRAFIHHRQKPRHAVGADHIGVRIPRLALRQRWQEALQASLLDVEIQTRQDEIARYRNRDRREQWAPTIAFDTELAESVGERLHLMGASAIDAHVAGLISLRKELLDGQLTSRSLTAVPAELRP